MKFSGILITFLFILNSLWAQKTETKVSKFRTRGLVSINDIGVQAGLGSYTIKSQDYANNETVITFSSIVSYGLNSHFALGAGLEFDKWRTVSFLPVFIDIRYYILEETPMNPFIFIDGGFARKWGTSPRTDVFKISSGSTGDFFAAAGLGLKTFLSKTTALNFSIGFKIQQINISYMVPSVNSQAPDLVSQLTNFQFLSIKTGLSF